MSFYPAEVQRRFCDRRFVGAAEPTAAVGTAGAPVCGAVTRLSLAIDPAVYTIGDAKFSCSGCGFAVAAASLLAETLIGTAVPDAAELLRTRRAWHALIAAELGELPVGRSHCAELALDALAEALRDHRATFPDHAPGEEALICTCFFVSERTIENSVRGGAATIDDVTRACRAGGGCGSCHPLIAEILESVHHEVEHDLFR